MMVKINPKFGYHTKRSDMEEKIGLIEGHSTHKLDIDFLLEHIQDMKSNGCVGVIITADTFYGSVETEIYGTKDPNHNP